MLRSEKYSNYTLVLTGHSLGAGVAAILSAMWLTSPTLPLWDGGRRLRCYGYGTPCVFSPNIARALHEHMTTVVLEDDMIVRWIPQIPRVAEWKLCRLDLSACGFVLSGPPFLLWCHSLASRCDRPNVFARPHFACGASRDDCSELYKRPRLTRNRSSRASTAMRTLCSSVPPALLSGWANSITLRRTRAR